MSNAVVTGYDEANRIIFSDGSRISVPEKCSVENVIGIGLVVMGPRTQKSWYWWEAPVAAFMPGETTKRDMLKRMLTLRKSITTAETEHRSVANDPTLPIRGTGR